MLTIRLQRVGKTKHAMYRLIVSEKGRDTQARYLENLGIFNPHDKKAGFLPKADRIKYWISMGATLSNTMNNLLIKNGIITGKKKKSVYLSKERKVKIAEKSKARLVEAEARQAKAAKPAEAAAPTAAPAV